MGWREETERGYPVWMKEYLSQLLRDGDDGAVEHGGSDVAAAGVGDGGASLVGKMKMVT